MRRFLLVALAVAFLGAEARPQQPAPWAYDEDGMQEQVGRVIVHGTVLLPGGQLPSGRIRVDWQSEDGLQIFQHVYTDSSGQFLVMLRPNRQYTFTVESDGENWATTVVMFIPVGTRPSVQINLRPLGRIAGPRPQGPAVSVTTLKQRVPRAAQRALAAAMRLTREGKGDEALAELEKALEAFPDYVLARNEMGVALMRRQQLEPAERHLRRAVELDPNSAPAQLNLGICLFRQKRYAEAITHLEQGLQLDPRPLHVRVMLGAALLEAGRAAEAETVLLHAYEVGGLDAAEAQFHLARLYWERNDPARAAAALETLLEDIPLHPNADTLRQMLGAMRSAAEVAAMAEAERKAQRPLDDRLPPPAEGVQRIRVDAAVMQEHVRDRVPVEYPAAARESGTEGLVRLEVLISPAGEVVDLRRVGGNDLLARAAMNAVRQWRYEPFRVDGRAFEVVTFVDMHFVLEQFAPVAEGRPAPPTLPQ